MSWARNSVGERGDNIGLPDVTTADNGKIMEVESGEWKLKEGSGGGGGIPAPASPSDGDVLTYSSTDSAWVAAAPSGGLHAYEVLLNTDVSDPDVRFETIAYASEIVSAAYDNGRALICPDIGAYDVYVGEARDEQQNEYYTLNISFLNAPEPGAIVLSLTNAYAEVLKSNIATEKFVFKWDDQSEWDIDITPAT